MRPVSTRAASQGWAGWLVKLARVAAIRWLPCFALVAIGEIGCLRSSAAVRPLSQVITLPAREDIPSHRVRVLFWPGQGIAARPLIVYEPGWNGSADENSVLASSLAAQGFDVVAIDLRTAQPAEFTPIAARLKLPLDFSTSDTLDQTVANADWRVVVLAEDAVASLNQLPQAVDAAGLGALGYSFGGAVAGEMCRRDRRFLACVNMDGWQFGRAARTPGPQPNMVLSGEPYPDRARPASQPEEIMDERDAACLRIRMATIGGLFAQINGLQHDDFTDRGGGNPVVQALVSAFFLENLRHQPSPLLASDNPLPGVMLSRFAPAIKQQTISTNAYCSPA